jgi:hypothetical protein
VWQHVKSGDWLTRARLRGYAAILLAIGFVAAVIWTALADGMIDRNGKPIGTDFSNVFAAGTLVLQGEAGAPYDPARQHQAEIAVFDGRPVPFFGWHYPPLFLVVAAGLALLPYSAALLAWLTTTLAGYVVVLQKIVGGRDALLAALAFPAVFVNLGHGQNGFLTAALLGGGLLMLDSRPWLAGLLIGLLAYKPQFGVLIPLVLLVTGRWSVIAAAVLTIVVAAALTTFLFGAAIWHAFADSMPFTRTVVLEQGGTGWPKIQSIFSAVRLWGGGVDMAYAAQLVLASAVAAALAWLWRSAAAFELKAAALACGCLLATPYVLDYDLVVLALAIAFVARRGLRHGFLDYEITLLAFAFIAPLVTRSAAGALGLPVGLLAVTALFIIALRRAAHDLAVARARSVNVPSELPVR